MEWAVASRPKPGAQECGDHAVAVEAAGSALFGVIDGLGHGGAAARAAARAAAVLTEDPAEPLDELIRRCHRALSQTRGATMTLASVYWDGSMRLSWTGVGNVGAAVIAAAPGGPMTKVSVLQMGGIVGYQLPASLHEPQVVSLRPGDLLVLHSDGIRGEFVDSIDLSKSARQVSADILAGNATASDDALVLAVRHRGVP